ncbi:hypothetical protein SNE40_012690 [Patella caerulea]|uniref:G-protein coupled receptors family 1 profile domain-containing protein n=1 Tax=Patella caerulea TaxID=87958 RepID=A0AAN8JS93_PATCE
MVQQSNATFCVDNPTAEECILLDKKAFLIESIVIIIIDILLITQNIVLLQAVRKLRSISKACRWIWFNELIVEIGMVLGLFIMDIITIFCGYAEWNHVVRDTVYIVIYTCLSISTHMLAANMYNINLAFQVKYDYSSISEKNVRTFLVASWILNIIISCTVLFDKNLLAPHPKFIVEFMLTKSNIWIILLQFINVAVFPTVCVLYSFIRIRKLQSCDRALSNTVQVGFQAGFKLASMLFRFYIIQLISLFPYTTFVFFGCTLKKYTVGVDWNLLENVSSVTVLMVSFLKLPIYILRNKELKQLLKCNICCHGNTVIPA